jgi:hypothetical protein
VALGRTLAHIMAVARGHHVAGADGIVRLWRHAFLRLQAGVARLPSDIAIDLTVLLGIAGRCSPSRSSQYGDDLCLPPFLREWASPLTVINYSCWAARPFTLAAAFSAWRPG